MLGRRTSINRFSLILVAAAAFGQTNVFPLDKGNTWIYRTADSLRGFTLEVTEVQAQDGFNWSRVEGFPTGDVWLRQSPEGTIYSRDAESGVERVWVDLGAKVGESWPAGVDPCTGMGNIDKSPANWTGAIGNFTNAVSVAYTPGCADAGITSDVYLPWVGLVARTYNTIAGPVSYELIYAHLGETTVISSGQVSFTFALDKRELEAKVPVAVASFRLRNGEYTPLKLHFPSGQDFDLVVYDSAGNRVMTWSLGILFTNIVRDVGIGRGEKSWTVSWPLAPGGQPLPPGEYTLEGWLSTLPIAYKATVPFVIH